MSVRVTVDTSKRQPNVLDLNVFVPVYNCEVVLEYTSSNYLCGINWFQVQINSTRLNGTNNTYKFSTCVRFNKSHKQDVSLYICKVAISETEQSLTEISFTEDGFWHHVFSKTISTQCTFDLSAIIDLAPTVNSFALLHEDIELTDFKLLCSKGTVNVHKAVLASASPVFHKMLIGKWKESNEGHVEFPVARIEDLENFKAYMYLSKVPENVRDLEKLFELGSCYIMPELLHICTVKMINKLSKDNVFEILAMAFNLKADNLLLYIIKHIKSSTLNFDEMSTLLGWNKMDKEE